MAAAARPFSLPPMRKVGFGEIAFDFAGRRMRSYAATNPRAGEGRGREADWQDTGETRGQASVSELRRPRGDNERPAKPD